MGVANTNMHVPYAIRFIARLQERAAASLEAEGKPADDLEQDARKLRVAADMISRGTPLSRFVSPAVKARP